LSVPIHKTLLIVDDDEAMLALVTEVARRAGLLVLTADGGAAFRQALLQAEPAMILLDLHMPGMDGMECLRYLASHGCKAEVALISGLEPKVLASARRFGQSLGLTVTDVLHKPVRVHEIEAILSRHTGDESPISRDDLLRALNERELLLHYQPILRRGQNGWLANSMEALVRWQHPQLGLLLPDRFLQVAERENLMRELTDFVLDESLRQLGHWHARGLKFNLSVNLPATCITDVEFPDRLFTVLAEHGVPPNSLSFDVTEVAVMGDPSVIMDVFARLRVNGVELALDDFGVGASSLTQLYKLPYTSLKVDRTLVRDAPSSQQVRSIVQALIGLGHQLSLRVCAEGVQAESAFDFLDREGCDLMQGDYISPPLKATDVEAFLRSWDEHTQESSARLLAS
jgi:EAL domain-containing protein (putative c-di-GMP-specific phosphodiesterase class I)/CheY-like chemotaxis protein